MTVMDQRLQLLDTDTWSARVRSRSNVCGPGRKSMDLEKGCNRALIAETKKHVGGGEVEKRKGRGHVHQPLVRTYNDSIDHIRS